MYWPYGNRQLKSPKLYASFTYANEVIFKLKNPNKDKSEFLAALEKGGSGYETN